MDDFDMDEGANLRKRRTMPPDPVLCGSGASYAGRTAAGRTAAQGTDSGWAEQHGTTGGSARVVPIRVEPITAPQDLASHRPAGVSVPVLTLVRASAPGP